MWDLNELGDEVRLSNPQALMIRGLLDEHAMRDAVTALVARQAALRTVFSLDGDRLLQTVCDRGPSLEVVDLSSCDESERSSQARALFDAIGSRHDLRRQPFRAQLVRLDDHEHVLLVAAHHIVLDGMSYGVLWSGSCSALYRASISRTTTDLAALDLQFTDFSFWQTTLVDRPVGKSQLDFWAKTIEGYQELELPGDLAAPSRASGSMLETYPMGVLPFAIEGASWAAVARLCSRLNVRPYSVVATALFLFLIRASGRREACVMSGNHHRNRPGSERVIGNFVTPYPIRIEFDETATLEHAVRHCDRVVLAHREQQGVGPVTAFPSWSEVTRYNLNYWVMSEHEKSAGARRRCYCRSAGL